MKGLLVFLLGFSTSASGNGFFERLRTDSTVPNHCLSVGLDNFDPTSHVDVLGYSTLGAKRKGFTHEVYISRSDAGFLFDVFRHKLHNSPKAMRRVKRKPKLHQAYLDILAGEPRLDIDYQVEGEILEALVLSRLMDSLPKTQFATGGVVYKESPRSRVLGEIDIWIADQKTCKVVAIGEVKLNPRLLGKARKQMNRFRKYITRWQRRKHGDSTDFRRPRHPVGYSLKFEGARINWDLFNKAFMLN